MRKEPPANPRWAWTGAMSRERLTGLLLALMTLLIYLPLRQHGFSVYDDGDYIAQNQIVQNGLTWAGVKWAFTTTSASNWHPLTWLSHMLDCELFGLDAGAHHLVNVLFHAANAMLLFTLLLRLTGAKWAAAVTAALFAWHPLHVQSVAWASERKDVLSTFFGLFALLAYARYVEVRDQRSEIRTQNSEVRIQRSEIRVSWPLFPLPSSLFPFLPSIFYLLSLACFALGLLAKPMLVTLPFVLLLLDYWPLGRFSLSLRCGATSPSSSGASATSVPRSIPQSIQNPQSCADSTRPVFPSSLFPLLSSFLVVLWRLVLEKWPFFLLSIGSCMVTFLAQREAAVLSFGRDPWPLRLGNALLSYAAYLLNTAWPVNLAVLYPLPQRVPWLQAAAAGASLAVVSWLVWRARRSQPYLLAGWLWYLGTLVPVIGLVQAGEQARADRYTYFPLIGIFLALVWLSRDVAARFQIPSRLLAVVSCLILAANAGLTEWQLNYWRDDVTLFARALAVTGDNPIAHINLGLALEQQGRTAEAMAHYQTAVRLAPDSPEAHNNLANLLDAAGQTNEALAHYQAVLQWHPQAMFAHCNLGTLLFKMGRWDEALRQYQEAARLQPADPRPYYLMGKVCLRRGQGAEAVHQFRHALELAPNDFPTLTFLARLLATNEDPSQRDGPAAVALAEKASNLAGGNQPVILDVLAMAYAETGRFKEAQQTADRALEIVAAANLPDKVAAIRQHLQLYQAGRPCRESVTNMLPANTDQR